MARFYGTVQGGRGEATRLGHESSGLRVSAQSYSGDIVVSIGASSAYPGEDVAHIYIRPHGGYGEGKTLYDGPISQLLSQSGRKTLMQALVADMLTGEEEAA